MKRLGIVALVLGGIFAVLIYANNRTEGELFGRCFMWLWKAFEDAKRELPPHDDRLLHATKGDDVRVDGIAFSPDGKWVFTCGSEGLKQWDAVTYKLVHLQTFDLAKWGWPNPVFSMAVDRNKPLVYLGTSVQEVQIWNHETRKIVGTIPTRPRWEKQVSAIALSADGKILAIAENGGSNRKDQLSTEDFSILLWDVKESRVLRRLIGHNHPVGCLGFLSNCEYLYSARSIYSLKTGDIEFRDKSDLGDDFTGSKPKQYFAVFHANLDFEKTQEVAESAGFRNWIRDSKLFGKGDFIATINADGFVTIEESDSGRVVTTYQQFGNRMKTTTVAVSPDGRVIVTGGDGHAKRGGFGYNDDQRDRNLCWWRIAE